jgi:hypothetical protein
MLGQGRVNALKLIRYAHRQEQPAPIVVDFSPAFFPSDFSFFFNKIRKYLFFQQKIKKTLPKSIFFLYLCVIVAILTNYFL